MAMPGVAVNAALNLGGKGKSDPRCTIGLLVIEK